MSNQARIFSRLMDWAAPEGSPADGVLAVRVEWSQLDGLRENGKFQFETVPLTTKARLAIDLVDQLVTYLNERYPSAGYMDRDIICWGA